MKNKLRSKPAKTWAFLTFLFPALLGGGVNAQIQPASMPDQYLAASGLATVNTALIECSPAVGNGFLSAVVWGNATATKLYIRHTNGQSVLIPITNAAPIYISTLPLGNYFISIQTKDGFCVTQPFAKD